MSNMIPWRDFVDSDRRDNFWRPACYEVRKKRKTLNFCDDIFCYDIETCNFFVDPKTGKVYSINDIFELCGYMPEKIEECFENFLPGCLPYIWQASVNDWVVYGREEEEFKMFVDYIADKLQGADAHFWVHNLSFEYGAVLRELFPFTKKFFTEARKPLKVCYNNITFRCSYRLTMLSLDKWGKQIGVPKLTGNLDYHGMFTPLTQIEKDDKIMDYCEHDLRVMIAGLKTYKKEYGHIKDIPLTQTGEIRRDLRQLNHEKRCNYKIAKRQPKSAEDWKVLHQAYNGGLVLCNPEHADIMLQCHDKNAPGYINVGTEEEPIAQRSVDRKSAYPAAMFEPFPTSEFMKTESKPAWGPGKYEDDGCHHICLVEFKNLRTKYGITPLSTAKRIMCKGVQYNDFAPARNERERRQGVRVNNGKVFKADNFACYLTERDFEYINLMYDFDEIIIHSHRIATSGWLDAYVLDYMLTLYQQKTLLRNDPDVVFYNRQKQRLNGISGMAGTALIRDEIIETEDLKYKPIFKDNDAIQKELDRLQQFPETNVIQYSAGIYITSHQRNSLMKTALALGPEKCSYFDTDSCKGGFNEADMKIIEERNREYIEWMKWRCAEQKLDYEKTCPKDTEGNPQYLGIYENDGNYFEIKYLGSKRYAYRESATDRTHITIAGVPKGAAIALNSPDDLREGMVFDFFNSHKNMAVYLDGDNPQVTMPDGYRVHNKCGVVIRPTSYKLTLEEEYRQLLKLYISQKQH